MTEEDDTLSWLNVYITLVLMSTFGCLQELRRVFGIPSFPRFLSYPNIICKRQTCTNANKRAVPATNKGEKRVRESPNSLLRLIIV